MTLLAAEAKILAMQSDLRGLMREITKLKEENAKLNKALAKVPPKKPFPREKLKPVEPFVPFYV